MTLNVLTMTLIIVVMITTFVISISIIVIDGDHGGIRPCVAMIYLYEEILFGGKNLICPIVGVFAPPHAYESSNSCSNYVISMIGLEFCCEKPHIIYIKHTMYFYSTQYSFS